MDSLDKTNKWLTLLANVGVIAGIVFLAQELQQANGFALAEQDRSRIEGTIALRSIIIENADVWAKGLSGAELPANDQMIFDYLLRTQWGHIFVQTQSRERFAVSNRAGLRDFATFLYQNPGARDRWMMQMEVERIAREALGSTIGIELRDFVLQSLQQLDQSRPDLPNANIL